MFHGMYEHVDRYGKVYHLSARVGGFTTQDQARKAVLKRSQVGYVTDANNVPLFAIRNGHVVKPNFGPEKDDESGSI